MALILTKTGITNASTIEAWHVTQSIDALAGLAAYNIAISGSLNLTGSLNTTGIINSSNSITGSILKATSYFSGSGAGLNNINASGSSGYVQYKSIDGVLTGNAGLRFDVDQGTATAFYIGDGTDRNNTIIEGDFTVRGDRFGTSGNIAYFSGSQVKIGSSLGATNNTQISGSVSVQTLSIPMLSGIGTFTNGTADILINTQLTSLYSFTTSRQHPVFITRWSGSVSTGTINAFTSGSGFNDGHLIVSSSDAVDNDSFSYIILMGIYSAV